MTKKEEADERANYLGDEWIVIEYNGWALDCGNCGILIPPKKFWKSNIKERLEIVREHFEVHEGRAPTKFVKLTTVK